MRSRWSQSVWITDLLSRHPRKQRERDLSEDARRALEIKSKLRIDEMCCR